MRIVFHGRDSGFLAAFAAVLFLEQSGSSNFSVLCGKASELLPELKSSRGTIIPVGRDRGGNLVCLLGRGREKRVVIQALIGYGSIFLSRELMVFFNLSNYENSLLRLGGMLYRYKRYKTASRILEYGMRHEYSRICQGLTDLSRRIAGRGGAPGRNREKVKG